MLTFRQHNYLMKLLYNEKELQEVAQMNIKAGFTDFKDLFDADWRDINQLITFCEKLDFQEVLL